MHAEFNYLQEAFGRTYIQLICKQLRKKHFKPSSEYTYITHMPNYHKVLIDKWETSHAEFCWLSPKSPCKFIESQYRIHLSPSSPIHHYSLPTNILIPNNEPSLESMFYTTKNAFRQNTTHNMTKLIINEMT